MLLDARGDNYDDLNTGESIRATVLRRLRSWGIEPMYGLPIPSPMQMLPVIAL